MNRETFLKRAALVIGALAVGHELELPSAEGGVVCDAVLTSTNDFELFDETRLVASGGLCAPLSPIYNLPSVFVGDSMPIFQAQRGGT